MVHLKYPWLFAIVTFTVAISYWCGKEVASIRSRRQPAATITKPVYLHTNPLQECTTHAWQQRELDVNIHTKSLNQSTTSRGPSYYNNSTSKEQYADAEAETACAEVLVHPLLLSHVNPQRVAVVLSPHVRDRDQGLAVLQQVIKHKTVKECVVLVGTSGQDEYEEDQFVNLPLYDDLRVTTVMLQSDPLNWFVENYSDGGDNNEGRNDNDQHEDYEDNEGDRKFDVIILDSLLDRESFSFADVIHEALKNNGILGGRLRGQGMYRDFRYYDMVENLEDAGFYTFRDYQEGSQVCCKSGQEDAVYFFMTTKRRFELSRWFASEAHVDLDIARRINSMVTRPDKEVEDNSRHQRNQDKLRSFIDGASMALYQVPSRRMESTFCQLAEQGGIDAKCIIFGLDPDFGNVPASAFELRPATNPKSGRGVFAKQDIPSNVYMGVDDGVHAMIVMPQTWNLIKIMAAADDAPMHLDDVGAEYFQPLYVYIEGYGMDVYHYGEPAMIVDPGIFTFVNHGCNGNFHTDSGLPVTESSARADEIPDDFEWEFYNPNLYRRHWVEQGCTGTLDQPLDAGTELFDNYLYLSPGVSLMEWRWIVKDLRDICNGGVGLVSDYEEQVNQNHLS